MLQYCIIFNRRTQNSLAPCDISILTWDLACRVSHSSSALCTRSSGRADERQNSRPTQSEQYFHWRRDVYRGPCSQLILFIIVMIAPLYGPTSWHGTYLTVSVFLGTANSEEISKFQKLFTRFNLSPPHLKVKAMCLVRSYVSFWLPIMTKIILYDVIILINININIIQLSSCSNFEVISKSEVNSFPNHWILPLLRSTGV